MRLRLTALYGALFLLAGALLTLTTFVLVRRDFDEALNNLLPSSAPSQAAPTTAEQLAIFRDTLRSQVVHQLVGHSALAWVIMAVVSMWLAWWAAGRALRPVQQVTATARRLSETSLHERIALTGPHDELREMADTFDAMLDRLEAAFEGQRRFVANASHELRTPLTIQRTLVEVALDNPKATAEELREALQQVNAVTARSQRLIENLLVLARSARGLSLQSRKEIDLAAVTRHALEQEWNAANQPALTLISRIEPAVVNGASALLGHLAANLIQNAIRHNDAGGWVEVTTRTSGDCAELTVRNSGQTIPPEKLDALFEPFSRLSPSRTESLRGSGLGLSIVQAVAQAHDAQVTAEPQPAGGLSMTVVFPSVCGRGLSTGEEPATAALE